MPDENSMSKEEYQHWKLHGVLPTRMRPKPKVDALPGSLPKRESTYMPQKPVANRAGDMNRTERRFRDEVLAPAKLNGEILDFSFERIKLRLAKRTWYTPDFIVFEHPSDIDYMTEMPQALHAFEIKGFWRDDARVKIKMAAELFPWIRFTAVQYKKNGWLYEEIIP